MSNGEPKKGYDKSELNDEMYSIDHMYRKVLHVITERQMEQSQKAFVQMEKYHAGQVRKGKEGVPYIAHPLLMACHAMGLGLVDDELIAVTLLHDVVEDCDVAIEELDANERVREAVKLLTFTKLEGESRAEAKARYFKAMWNDPLAGMVKLLDRTNNISHMAAAFTREKLISYIEETEAHVFPLLNHIKHTCPEYYNAVFLLKYQMLSVMETLKHIL